MDEGMETLSDHRISVTAPVIFIIVVAFQFLSRWLEHFKKDPRVIRRLGCGKRFEPSTFAQAAKLRRMATAKEKELVNYQELPGKDEKVLTYLVLVCWFWRVLVASISQQLVQPFGKVILWRAGGFLNGNVMVGIIPWLILCTRVSKFVCRLFKSSSSRN